MSTSHATLLHLPSEIAPAGDAAAEEWALLFGAVIERLRRYVAEATEVIDPQMRPLALNLKGGALDCVCALEQLRRQSTERLAREQAREQQLQEALALVDRLQAELAGSRAGMHRPAARLTSASAA